ncbi:MAG: hypothetical protein V7643_2983 [Mycobacterium sp.]
MSSTFGTVKKFAGLVGMAAAATGVALGVATGTGAADATYPQTPQTNTFTIPPPKFTITPGTKTFTIPPPKFTITPGTKTFTIPPPTA